MCAATARRIAEKDILHLHDDGRVPNNELLPLIVYRGALALTGDAADAAEALFARHGWGGAWRDGIYPYHHYHATTHEVLGLVRGTARVRFGGEEGETVELAAGDVVIIPAGVAHKCEDASDDLLVVGAYPGGSEFDMCRQQADHDHALAAVRKVPLPAEDPVHGAAGPLFQHWRERSDG